MVTAQLKLLLAARWLGARREPDVGVAVVGTPHRLPGPAVGVAESLCHRLCWLRREGGAGNRRSCSPTLLRAEVAGVRLQAMLREGKGAGGAGSPPNSPRQPT